jgi:hypothetical protein
VGERLVFRTQVAYPTLAVLASGLASRPCRQALERNFALDDPLRMILDGEFGGHGATERPTGALIGMVNVVDFACRQECRAVMPRRATMIESAEIFRLDGAP